MSLVRCLPEGLEAAVAVAVHVPEESPSALPAILTREGPLRAAHAVDAELLHHGRIYVARPGHHLLVKRRTLRSVNGPNENGHRPAVDPLFRTAARAHGRRTVGVVLSGSLDDGTAGLQSVKHHGGAALVQDPDEALFSGMPTSAIENVAVDFVGEVSALASELVRRIAVLAADDSETGMSDDEADALDVVEMHRGTPDPKRWAAGPSPYTCPECHGSLFECQEEGLIRFRCRTGHAYSQETLVASQAYGVESALWIALRALEENAALLRRMGDRASERGLERSAQRFRTQAGTVEMRARVIREGLMKDVDGSAVA